MIVFLVTPALESRCGFLGRRTRSGRYWRDVRNSAGVCRPVFGAISEGGLSYAPRGGFKGARSERVGELVLPVIATVALVAAPSAVNAYAASSPSPLLHVASRFGTWGCLSRVRGAGQSPSRGGYSVRLLTLAGSR